MQTILRFYHGSWPAHCFHLLSNRQKTESILGQNDAKAFDNATPPPAAIVKFTCPFPFPSPRKSKEMPTGILALFRALPVFAVQDTLAGIPAKVDLVLIGKGGFTDGSDDLCGHSSNDLSEVR
jgi:hypothetical protein